MKRCTKTGEPKLRTVPFLLCLALSLLAPGCANRTTSAPARDDRGGAATQQDSRVIPVNEIQGNALVYPTVYDELSPENALIRIHLSRQIARVYAGDRLAIRTPISSGVASNPTPTGSFTILEKKEYHESTLYGSYVRISDGEVILRDVNSRRTPPPPQTKWKGTPVPYWQRITWTGVGLHVGKLPGHPASNGCLRFPSAVMPLIYEKTRIGTPVEIE